jgi:hypothetical protein
LELPKINYQLNTKNYNFLYAAGMSSDTNFNDRLVKIDVKLGTLLVGLNRIVNPENQFLSLDMVPRGRMMGLFYLSFLIQIVVNPFYSF